MIIVFVAAYVLFVLGAVAMRCRRGLRAIAHARAARDEVRAIWSGATHDPEIRVVLLLPMLREQSEAAALLDHLCTLDFPPDRVTLVPVTTEVESMQRDALAAAASAIVDDLRAGNRGLAFLWKHCAYHSTARLRELARMDADAAQRALDDELARPTTAEVVRALVAERAYRFPVVPIHYPRTTGNKASQMNYALDVLQQRGAFDDPDHTYVGVYDADSRPHRLTLASLAVGASRELAPAFQQYPIYFNGSPLPSRLMRNEAWLQTARSVCIEYGGQLEANEAIDRDRGGRTFTYCIGHGEFLRSDWLLRMRFPESTSIDDMPTGMALSLARQKIVPLPFFDFCTVPYGILDFVRQTGTWFATSIVRDEPLQLARSHFGEVAAARVRRLRIEQTISNVRWTIRGPARLTMLAIAIAAGPWPLVPLLIAAWLVETAALWRISFALIDGHGETEHLPRLRFNWAALLRAPLKSAGPCAYLSRRLRRHAATEYKTARA